MINLSIAALAKTLLSMILAFFSSSTQTTTAHVAMLNAGDQIAGMTLTNGAVDALPLWLFCSSDVRENVTNADCHVPQTPKLAIGHIFAGSNEIFQGTDWSELKWKLVIDGQPVNLEDFGTYDYVLPTMTSNPSLVREVFMKFRAWDVVLTELQPGNHTIQGEVSSDQESYQWVVNLVIERSSPPKENRTISHFGSW